MKYHHQKEDIIGAILNEVRATLGIAIFPAEVEKKIEEGVRLTWGGAEVYVRKTRNNADARALAIRAEYNMCNRRELQAKYNLGRAQFYKILKGG